MIYKHTCKKCNKEFTDEKKVHIFCSKKCYSEWMRGKKVQEMFGIEMAQARADKISATMKRKISSGEIVVKIPREKSRIYLQSIKGKKIEDVYGKERALAIKKKTLENYVYRSGWHLSAESRKSMFKLVWHNPEVQEKIRLARRKQITPKKDSKIEVKIQNYLKELGVDFFTHQYMKNIEHGYQCDIFIPAMDLVIECDGDYWHKYPIGRDIDHIRTKELIAKGFKVLRLWECEIEVMSIDDFKKKVLDK